MKTFLLLLMPLFSLCQTWPTKDCPDIPYTKGNDNIIYHTCDCGAKLQVDVDSGSYWSTTTITGTSEVRGYVWKGEKWKKISETKKDYKYVIGANHPDSLWCPMCLKFKTYRHVLVRQEFGILSRWVDENGTPNVTPLGSFLWPYARYDIDLDKLRPYKKYLPAGFLSDKNIRKYWIKLLDDTE